MASSHGSTASANYVSGCARRGQGSERITESLSIGPYRGEVEQCFPTERNPKEHEDKQHGLERQLRAKQSAVIAS